MATLRAELQTLRDQVVANERAARRAAFDRAAFVKYLEAGLAQLATVATTDDDPP